MKRLSLISTVLFLAGTVLSCSPQTFTMNVEMRQPSLSGLELGGKSMAVAYLDNGYGKDSVFTENLAGGFASAMEKDYFGGEEVIDIYKMPKDNGVDYASKDTLLNILMDSGDDVVFLFDSPEFGDMMISDDRRATADSDSSAALVSLPVKIRLYVYDGMNKVDSMYVYQGSTSVNTMFTFPSSWTRGEIAEGVWNHLGTSGEAVGEKSSKRFLSKWKEEQYTLMYFDSPSLWGTAAQAAYEYRWHDAIEAWMKLVKTNNLTKRSCAEYNIATALYMLGDYDLALQWLDQSDKDQPISLSPGLRKRITSRKGMK